MIPKSTTRSGYRHRKILFWVILVLIAVGAALIFLLPTRNDERKTIRVGICGAVRVPAVYTMAEGADLGMLVRRANGFKAGADILKVNLHTITQNDTIYHIPAGGNARGEENALQQALNTAMKMNFSDLSAPATASRDEEETRQINVLYVGFPAVYMLISYYPDYGRVSINHIPHTTLFLNNDYRLIDLFFTLGIDPTVKLLENRLCTRIHYYLIQDRFSFIDLVDNLNGIELNLDAPFAEAYNLTPGIHTMDGFHTWEYIRFLDMRRIKPSQTPGKGMDLIREDNFKASPQSWQLAYEQRHHRQKLVMAALRKAYAAVGAANKLEVISRAATTFETNIDQALMIELYTDVLNTPDFSYGTLPGYYSNEGEKLFFYPDIPSFNLLRKHEIKTNLVKKGDRKQTVY